MPEEPDGLTPAEKLRAACEMHDLGVAIMRQNLRRQHSDASDAELDRKLQDWLGERPGATDGDAAGRRRA